MFGFLYKMLDNNKRRYTRPSLEREDFQILANKYCDDHDIDNYNIVLALLAAFDNYEIEYDEKDIELYVKKLLKQ